MLEGEDEKTDQPKRRVSAKKKPSQHKGGELVQVDDFKVNHPSPTKQPNSVAIKKPDEIEKDQAYYDDEYYDEEAGSSYDEEIY